MSSSAFRAAPFALLFVMVAAACEAVVLPADDSEDAGSDAPANDVPPDAVTATDAGRDASVQLPEPPVACGAPLPGPPMANVVESAPGFEAELAATDTAGVPDPLDYAGESALTRSVVNYMLGRASGTSVARADALDAGVFGKIVLASAAKADAGVDNFFLRRGLHYAYPCSRPVPANLEEVVKRYGDYRAWPSDLIECSRPKNGPRRLYTDPSQGVFVAETVVGGRVRETEILFSRLRSDGQLDFAAYTEAGELTDRSTFATASSEITSSAPYTCMTCHLDQGTGSLSRLFPSGTGAGCK